MKLRCTKHTLFSLLKVTILIVVLISPSFLTEVMRYERYLNRGVSIAQADSSDPWYDTNWAYRKKITIDHTKISNTDQANFPVLISTTDASLKTIANGGKINNNGYDVVFTSQDGSTKLDYEMESYISTTGQITAWVKIPTLSASVDTAIYVYYGNSGINASEENKAGVWDDGGANDFKAVYHMNQDPSSTAPQLEDSTQYLNNGTSAGTMTTSDLVAGEAGNGIDFDGTDDYIDIPDSSSLDTTNEITLETWMKARDAWNGLNLISKDAAYALYLQYPNTLSGYLRSNGVWYKTLGNQGLYIANQWYLFTMTYKPAYGTIKLYLNGQEVAYSSSTAFSGTITNSTSPLSIGKNILSTNKFNGIIDEVRLSDVARSSDWIKTEYNNQSSPSTFFSVGPEEVTDHFILSGASSQVAGDSQTVTLTATAATGTTYTDYTGDKAVIFSGAESTGDFVPTCNDIPFGTPTTLTFTNGVATCNLKLYKAETATINVTNGAYSAAGHTLGVTVSSGILNSFDIVAPANATTGASFSLALTARDAYGNIAPVTNSTALSVSSGTIDITSITADGFQANGTYTGNVTISGVNQPTNVTLTVQNGSVNQTAVIWVTEMDHFVLSGSANQTAGGSQTLTINAINLSGNTYASYTGDKVITFSGAGSIGDFVPTCNNVPFGTPTTLTFTNGVASCNLKLYKAETATINVTDGVYFATAHTLSVAVSSNSLNGFDISAPSSATSGTEFPLTLTAKDAYGNITTTVTNPTVLSVNSGAINTSSIAATAFQANGIYAGNITVSQIYKTATVTLTAINGAISQSVDIAVTGVDQMDHFVVSGKTAVLVGRPQTLTVTAIGRSGDTYVGYNKQENIIFSGANGTGSSSPICNDIPFGTDTTLTFANGVATCQLKLYTAETATINVTDDTYTATGHTLGVVVSDYSIGMPDTFQKARTWLCSRGADCMDGDGHIDGYTKVAVRIVFDKSFTITNLGFSEYGDGSGTYQTGIVNGQLVNDNNGLPGTNVYAEAKNFNIADTVHKETREGWKVEPPVAAPYTVTAGIPYWIVYTWISGKINFALGTANDYTGFRDFDTRYTTRFWNGTSWVDQGLYGVVWVTTTETGTDHIYGQTKLRRDQSAYVGDYVGSTPGMRNFGQIATIDSTKTYQLNSFFWVIRKVTSTSDVTLTIENYDTHETLWQGDIGKPNAWGEYQYDFSSPKPIISGVSRVFFYVSADSPSYEASSIEFYDEAHSWGAIGDHSLIVNGDNNWVTVDNWLGFDAMAHIEATTLGDSAPAFSPLSGTYSGPIDVTITSGLAGATIYYTLNGSDPTTSSAVYSSPIAISSDTTVKAMAVKSGYSNSAITTASYSIVSSDRYVSTTGSDTNDGLTPETPWKTIAYAAAQAEAGDTINIQTGTYGNEKVVLNQSGTSMNSIIFRSYDGTVSLTGDGTGTAWSASGDYITIDGDFVFDNYNNGVNVTGRHISVKGVTVQNMLKDSNGDQGDGIVTAGGSSYVTIDGCTVTNVGGHGIFSFGYGKIQDHITVQNCTVNGAGHNGIDIHSDNQNVLVENNTIIAARNSAAIYTHNTTSSIVMPRNNNIIIRNNTIDQTGGGDRGIWAVATDNTLIENNTISNCPSYGVFLYSAVDSNSLYQYAGNRNVTIRNNTFSTLENHGDIAFYSESRNGIQPLAMDNIIINDNNFTAKAVDVMGVADITNGVHLRDIHRAFNVVFESEASNTAIEYADGTVFSETTPSNIIFSPDKSSLELGGLSNVTYAFTPYALTAKPASGTASVLVSKFDATATLPIGTVLVEFIANSTNGNNTVFTVGTLKAGVNYLVKKDGTTQAVVMSDENGLLTFSNSSWSEHSFTVEETNQEVTMVTAPTFSLPSGTYATSQTVTLSSSTAGAIIHYTNDGTSPTSSSPVYSLPLTISASTTIKAIAVKEGYTDSAVSTAIYTLESASSDATLSHLTLSVGTLSPAFSSSTTSYSASVSNSVSSITLTPTVNETHASVTVNGISTVSGFACSPIVLNVGTNTIPVRITAQDGTIKTYTLIVTREAASGGSGSGGSGGSGGGSSTHPKPKPREIKITTVAGNSVGLSLAVDDASSMMLADNSNFTGSSWETYQTSKTYTKKDNQNKLYLRFKSSYNILSDMVTLEIPLAGGSTSSYPTGTLLKTLSSFKTYVMIEGKKKWIPTPEVFEQLGYKWTEIKTLTDTELNAIADYEDNLIRTLGDYKVYLVVNGVKRHIPDPEVFLNYGFAWNEVKDVEKAIVDKYKDTYLLKQSGTDGIYYVNSLGIRKLIPSDEVFKSYNDKYEEVQVISAYEMGKYPLSNLIKLGGSNDIYLIEGSIKRHIPSSEAFNRYHLNWNLVMNVNQTEFNFYTNGGELR